MTTDLNKLDIPTYQHPLGSMASLQERADALGLNLVFSRDMTQISFCESVGVIFDAMMREMDHRFLGMNAKG